MEETGCGMPDLTDFVSIVHRKSGLFVDVRPAREGQAETGQDAFKRNARIGIALSSFFAASGAERDSRAPKGQSLTDFKQDCVEGRLPAGMMMGVAKLL